MLNKISKYWQIATSFIDDFLFGKDPRMQLGVMRFILCGVLFYVAIFRQMNIEQYGSLSIIPRDAALNIFPDFYRPLVQWFFWPDTLASQVHFLLILLLGLACVGLTNRPLLLFTWMLHQGFLNRNYAMLFGADVIGGLFLLYLSFTKCCDFFSLKNIILKKMPPALDHSNKASITKVFYRLMQLQICTIYMYTGFEKLKGSSWWDGTALWTVFANPQFSQFDLKFLSHIPIFFAVGTFITLIFEVYFPAIMLHKKYRKYWLIVGVAFHLTIGILLGLMTFSLAMLSTYVLFVRAEVLQNTLTAVSQNKKN